MRKGRRYREERGGGESGGERGGERGGGEILHPVASLPFNLYRAPVSIVDESKISINRPCILVILGTGNVLCPVLYTPPFCNFV